MGPMQDLVYMMVKEYSLGYTFLCGLQQLCLLCSAKEKLIFIFCYEKHEKHFVKQSEKVKL